MLLRSEILVLNSIYWYLEDAEDGDGKSPPARRLVKKVIDGDEVIETWSVGGREVVKRFKIAKRLSSTNADSEDSSDDEAAVNRQRENRMIREKRRMTKANGKRTRPRVSL